MEENKKLHSSNIKDIIKTLDEDKLLNYIRKNYKNEDIWYEQQ